MSTAALQRTVRRSAALVVIQLGVIAGLVRELPTVHGSTFASDLLLYGAVLYLGASLLEQVSKTETVQDLTASSE